MSRWLPSIVAALFLLGTSTGQRPTAPAVRSTTSGGVFTSFYANGVVRDRGPVDATGKRTGRWQTFWPNGRLAADGPYEAGERQGQWAWRDPYGRVFELVWCGDQRHEFKQPECVMLPLRVEDLRCGVVGMTTVGALIDRFAAATDDDAGDRECTAVARELASAPYEAVGVPFSIAEELPPERRTRWLRLVAAMPLPETMPVEQLLAWAQDPVCGEAAVAVLSAWSRKFVEQWQPLVSRGSADPDGWSRLHALGVKAYAALPELRRQIVDEKRPVQVGWLLAALHGEGPRSPLAPWLAALEDSDAGRRTEAVQMLTTKGMLPPETVPAATLVRLLCDPCAAVARSAAFLTFQVEAPTSAEDLERIARSPLAEVRLAAARRLHALGRDADAETIWRQVATSEPLAMDIFGAWDPLAQHTREPDAVRELLFERFAHGSVQALLALQRVANVDQRVCDAMVEIAGRQQWLRGDVMSTEMRQVVEERVSALLDDPNTPTSQRGCLFQNLMQVTGDDAARRRILARCLDHNDPAVRMAALRYGTWFGFAPSAAQWRVLLADPGTRPEVAAMLATLPLPADFDPTPHPVAGVVLASWADGKPQRIAQLIERLLGADAAALEAILLLRPDLRASEPRFPQPGSAAPPFWRQYAPQLAGLLPDFAAEWRIFAALQSRNDSVCPPPMPMGWHQHQCLMPVDQGLIAAVARRLVDRSAERRAEAISVLLWLGADGNPLLGALRAALPAFTAAELARLPELVCAIAPEAAAELCEPLLEHTDPQVVAAVLGPRGIARVGKVVGGGPFACKLAARMAGDSAADASSWFAVLGDAIAALPELRAGLLEHPDRCAIATAIRNLGAAAGEAVSELLAALPHNRAAHDAVRAVLSPQQRLHHFLPLLETDLTGDVGQLLAGIRVDDPAMLARLERLAADERVVVRSQARQLLIASASESAAADLARLDALRRHEGGLPDIALRHWARLWPQLTPVELSHWLSHLSSRMRPPVLPADLVDALAAAVDTDTSGMAFLALVQCAPLHPRVLDHMAAATRFWNLPPKQPEYALPATHAAALLSSWKAGDAAFRAAALPWLRRQGAAVVRFAYEPARGIAAGASLTRLEVLDLFEQLRVTEGLQFAIPLLRETDPAVRRAALRAAVASEPGSTYVVQAVHACLFETTWAAQFGTTDGLPEQCAAIAAMVPSVAERAKALRSLGADRPADAMTAIAADVPAALLLLPELRELLALRPLDRLPAVLGCLRRLGTDAAVLLPAVEALERVPCLHFDVVATARILRGDAPIEPAPTPGRGPGGSPIRVPHWR